MPVCQVIVKHKVADQTALLTRNRGLEKDTTLRLRAPNRDQGFNARPSSNIHDVSPFHSEIAAWDGA